MISRISDFIKNNTIFLNKYHTHSDAIIVSCFFNPQNSPYRIKAFNMWYESIKHLNHSIIECVIGDSEPQLEESENIKRVYTKNLLWHKETLLNKTISELPKKYKYVFWVDADVLFTNNNWLVDGVKELQSKNIIQPFEYCVHLEKDETEPSFSMKKLNGDNLPNSTNSKVWRSFCANYATTKLWRDENYNAHGHVGFAWAARREVLDKTPLYDKALIGGADHIIAHAAAGQIGHKCIAKSFTDNIDEISQWSEEFFKSVRGKIGYVKGDLYHIWHGDINNRQYLKRIQDFTSKSKDIVNRDENGLFITNNEDDTYMKNYFKQREVSQDDGFINSMVMGYVTDNALLGGVLGGNMMGAMIGDMLNNSDEHKAELGGGEFGGSGSGGDIVSETVSQTDSETVSISPSLDMSNSSNSDETFS